MPRFYSKQIIAATFPIQNVLFNINAGILMLTGWLTIIPFVTLGTEIGSKREEQIVTFHNKKKIFKMFHASY